MIINIGRRLIYIGEDKKETINKTDTDMLLLVQCLRFGH